MSLYSDIYEFMILQGTELHRGNQWYFVIWQQDLDLCFSVTDGLGMASLAMYLRLACQHSWTPMGRGAHYIDFLPPQVPLGAGIGHIYAQLPLH